MSSQDLFAIQQQLKKTILAHQIAVSKLQTDPQNPVLQKELHELQTSIKTLSEQQKIKVQSLKQEVLKDKTSKDQNLENGVINSNNNSINNSLKTETQIKPIIQRPALIIPQLGNKQSVAINTQSIKRPALAIKSITGQTQFLVPVANTSMKNKLLVVPKQKVLNYLKPVVKMPAVLSDPNKTSSAPALRSSTNSAQPLHSTSILIRQNSKTLPKVPPMKSLNTPRIAPKLTDKQMKDHFMSSLGLVTKETLSELQNRKCERKRRTTANPQFSSAALEAKRITKLELAERKAKRRLLITNNSDNTSTQTTKTTTYLNNGSNNKSIGVEQTEISPGVFIVTSIGKHFSANCYVCDELCECDCDSILFCKPCKTLFHATCSTTKADITKNNALPKCPKCESVRKKNVEKLAKKREERDNLLVKKREFEDQLSQMRRALTSLKLKLKEKNQEKVTLVSNHEKVQLKVDKIIETLKLVEDTSEWEDGFAAALEATAPKAQTPPPTEPESAGDEENADTSEPNSAEVDEAMDVETSVAAQQLEQINKANDSLELGNEENEIYGLECHENSAEMYDIFVEEVHESVVADNVGFFDSEVSADAHMKVGHEFSQEEHQVMLY